MEEEAKLRPLVGEVSDIFTFLKSEDLASTIEAKRVEQEMVTGYPLVVKSTRVVEMRDMQGRPVLEVYATFAPAESTGDAA